MPHTDSDCLPARRCHRRSCPHCGPIRQRDELRKFQSNIAAYGGDVLLVAVTAPGADRLPWDTRYCKLDTPHRCSGQLGCIVKPNIATHWNHSASDRYRKLYQAAAKHADRLLRSEGWKGPLPRRVAVVWAAQRRGVWHVHEAFPAATPAELRWSRAVVEYLSRFAPRYHWGYVDRNPLRRDMRNGSAHAARYLARNAAGYLTDNAQEAQYLPGRRLRSYISRALTQATGCTMRSLRDARYLYVCLTEPLPLPAWDARRFARAYRLAFPNGIPTANGP